MSERIRVGVILDTLHLPAWQFEALESISKSDFADIAVVVLCRASDAKPVPATPYFRLLRCLHAAYARFADRKRIPEPDACARKSAEPLLHSAIHFSPPDPDSEPAGNRRPDFVVDHDIDVLIVFAHPDTVPACAWKAPMGVWLYTCSGRPFSPPDGTMVGFAELIRRKHTLDTSLEIYESGTRVRRTAFATQSAIDYSSHYVTRNEHLWKCSTFVLRALKQCIAVGKLNYVRQPPVNTDRGWRVANGLLLIPVFCAYVLWRAWMKVYRRLFLERWVLMAAVDASVPGVGDFKTLEPPRDRFWADPHVVEKAGRHHVFFEDASRSTGIGHLSVMSDDGNGRFGPPLPILRRSYHLSYPFVFQWRDNWYLVPESAQHRRVELFRAVRFPETWELECALLEDVEAYDSTLVEHAGRWWLFATIRARPGASTWDELHIFHSDNPTSRLWHAHRNNPVISDVSRARPGGPFYVEEGRLYRPSQDSALRYGHALRINEVIELSEHRYEERTVRTISAKGRSAVRAVHSYSRAGRLTFIDAIRRESRASVTRS